MGGKEWKEGTERGKIRRGENRKENFDYIRKCELGGDDNSKRIMERGIECRRILFWIEELGRQDVG